MAADPVQELLFMLQGERQTGPAQWQARCPAHPDEHASLCISRGDDGKVLVYCQAGCTTAAVLGAVGMTMADLFIKGNGDGKAKGKGLGQIVKVYDYHDAAGKLLSQKVRFVPKGFSQRQPDGEGHWVWGVTAGEYVQGKGGDWSKPKNTTPADAPRKRFPECPAVLYRLPELLAADPSAVAFIVEGEKDADNLIALGLVATTNPGGADKWGKLSDDSALHGRAVAIIPDKDGPGRKHALDVAHRLHDKAASVKIIDLPGDGKDASDFIEGRDSQAPEELRDALLAMVEAAREWTPPATGPDSEQARLTDLGNAQRFTNLAAGRALYCTQWGRWLTWGGIRWQVDEALNILTMAKRTALAIFAEAKTDEERRWAVKSHSRERLAAMVDLARPELAVSVEALDADPFALNVVNGVVNLRTGQLRPHRPDDRLTRLAPVRFDPDAACPLFLAFMQRIMASNAALIDYVQRLAGMCLTADISEQALWLFHGQGANGKSVLLDTLAGMMGDYAGEAPPDLLLMRSSPEHPTEIADLCGRRLVAASETDEGRRLRVQLVKRLTGNARLKARFMRGDYFEFPRTHKLILATNNRPIIKETTLAIWRRIKLVPFDVTIPPDEQDRHLTAKLKTEWPGILAWAVRGCLAWQRDGLTAPAEVEAATASYQAEQDPLAEFLESCCTFNPLAQVSRSDLFNVYSTWADHAKEHHPIDRTAFYERIRQRPGVGDGHRRVDGKPTRLFTGIGLVDSELFAHEA